MELEDDRRLFRSRDSPANFLNFAATFCIIAKALKSREKGEQENRGNYKISAVERGKFLQRILGKLHSKLPLGVGVDGTKNCTSLRFFSPQIIEVFTHRIKSKN